MEQQRPQAAIAAYFSVLEDPRRYNLSSSGPDGQTSNEDDITFGEADDSDLP